MTHKSPDTNILYCGHCGNKSVQTELLQQQCLEKFWTLSDGRESEEEATYTVARCETCAHLLLYCLLHNVMDDEDEPWGYPVYPVLPFFDDSVPDNVARIYREALLVKNQSAIAFVILARRVLEEICKEQGVSGNLVNGLGEMAEKNVIPTTLSEATTLIRLVGNAGAHASEARITMIQVLAIDDFVKAIIEYIYVAPKKIEEFRNNFKHFKE